MTIYTCSRCLKDFKQKSHYDNHLKKKSPCPDIKSKTEKLAIELINKNIIETKKKDSGNIVTNEINENDESIIDLNIQKSDKKDDKSTDDSKINDDIKNSENIEIKHQEGLKYLNTLDKNSINLILTDPPYITSRESGMDTQANKVKKYDKTGKNDKSEEEWKNYKTKEEWKEFFSKNNIPIDKQEKKLEEYKNNFLKYGAILGKKYAVVTNYGDWDKNFTIDKLKEFVKEFYRVLKKGGTAIIFFDLWKITTLKKIMDDVGFKQIRFIEWIKTNPQPLNSSLNYLTNCREIALLGVKGGKPTFNSKYDNGIYNFPIEGGKYKFHPTQKSLKLFEALILKHSNNGDIILDPFFGSGTTARACINTNRKFKGCEIIKDYYDKVMEIIKKNSN